MEANLNKYWLKPIVEAPITLVGCLIALALIPLFYILLKIYCPNAQGMPFYKSQRVGKNGKPFTCYKFRTMVINADSDLNKLKQLKPSLNIMEGPIFKIKNDPRLLPFGTIVRRFSLDEFPQFFNVLIGNMNVVGPRPPTLLETTYYNQEHKKRLAVKPGITGLWQTSGRNEIKNFQEVLNLDLKYINNWTPLLDIKIILKTIWVVLHGKGAY